MPTCTNSLVYGLSLSFASLETWWWYIFPGKYSRRSISIWEIEMDSIFFHLYYSTSGLVFQNVDDREESKGSNLGVLVPQSWRIIICLCSWVVDYYGEIESQLLIILLHKDKRFSSWFRSYGSKLISQGEIINFPLSFCWVWPAFNVGHPSFKITK